MKFKQMIETFIIHPSKVLEIAVKTFLEAMNVPCEKKHGTLPIHVLEGIKRGQDDFKSDRTLTLERFKTKCALGKNI